MNDIHVAGFLIATYVFILFHHLSNDTAKKHRFMLFVLIGLLCVIFLLLRTHDLAFMFSIVAIALACLVVLILTFRPFRGDLGNVMHIAWSGLCIGVSFLLRHVYMQTTDVPYSVTHPIVAILLLLLGNAGVIHALFPWFSLDAKVIAVVEDEIVQDAEDAREESPGTPLQFRSKLPAAVLREQPRSTPSPVLRPGLRPVARHPLAAQ